MKPHATRNPPVATKRTSPPRGTVRRCARLCATAAAAALVLAALTSNADATNAPGWALHATSYPTDLLQGSNATLSITPSAGAFTLTYENQTTKTLAAGTPATQVQAALEELSTIGHGNITIAPANGESYTAALTGSLGDMKGAELEANGATVTVTHQGTASATIGIDIFNLGAAAGTGTITVTDRLPAGVQAKEAGALIKPGETGWGTDPILRAGLWDCSGNGAGPAPGVAGATIVTCVNDANGLPSFEGGGGVPYWYGNDPQPPIGIAIAAPPALPAAANHVSISGGGAPVPAATQNPLVGKERAEEEPAHTGLTGWDAWATNADGTTDTEAGSHPYEFTTVFDLATTLNSQQEGELPGGEIRDLEVQLPPGLLGNIRRMPQCTNAELQSLDAGTCPQASEIGTLEANTFFAPILQHIYNMVPPAGEPAQFAFRFAGVPVYIDFTVRTGSDYGITAHIDNIAQRTAYQAILNIWGVPGEKSHNVWRGKLGGCTREEMEENPISSNEENYCAAPQHPVITPLLSLPTQCETPTPYLIRELSGWQQPAAKSELMSSYHDASGEAAAITGCEDLAFGPALTAGAETAEADSPSGFNADVNAQQGGLEEPGSLTASAIRTTTVTLPAGFAVNPGQAAGLQACSRAAAALEPLAENQENTLPADCPPASLIGTVHARSPLIEGATEKEFNGSVYVLPSDPPDVKLLAAMSADGVNIKLELDAHLNETTGQITTTLLNAPQAPVSSFTLTLDGGNKATLTTPARCGSYETTADFTPWSSPSLPDALSASTLQTTTAAGGGACPVGALPFAPNLTAGTTNTEAGAFTPFVMHLTRGDGQQRVNTMSFKTPQGLAAIITGVPECGETEANAGTCSTATRIGHAVVQAGPGNSPLTLPQPGEPEIPIYLTGPYQGAPFGLSIVTPVIAGPFNLGPVITRARIEVDPATAQITVTTDPLPQIVKGVPTDIRSIEAIIDRPNFMFNPTSCTAQTFTGTAQGTAPIGAPAEAGQTAGLTSPFDVGGCRGLTYTPKVTVSTAGHASRSRGAELKFKLAYPKGAMGHQAWFKEARFTIPKQLPAENRTLQQACPAKTFETDIAACPKHSRVGQAVVHTPILPVPLTGPVYLVSYGGAKFPDAVMDLTGDNVHIRLTGETFINSQSYTSVTFPATPDLPFETVEVTLPTGEYPEFGAYATARHPYDFCGKHLTVPTFLKAQNGLEVHRNTPLTITGCPKPKKAKKAAKRSRHGKR